MTRLADASRSLIAAAAVPFLLSSIPALAADDSCAVVLKALENVVTTPVHVYSTETSAHRGTSESETIYLDGKIYVQAHGRWILSPVTAAEMKQQQRENRKHAALTCQIVGEERVGDRMATIYASHRKTADSQTDARLWVDKVSGLLLRQEEEMSAGPNNTVRRSSRFEYGAVRAPKIP